MPDLPTIAGGPSETGSTPASSTGITLTANASANTKATSWTEVIASTDYASNWLLVMLHQASGSIAYLIDIGVGASTAEHVLIANLYLHAPAITSAGGRAFLFPVRIPAGTRLSARCQASTGSGTVRIAAAIISSPIGAPPGLTRVETIGANTADSNGVSVDCGGTANTDVVGELTAATGFAYRWFCLAVANPTDVAWGGYVSFLVDVMTGAAGSEVPVISDLNIAGASSDDRPNPSAVCFPCAIAAGARVAIRARCSVNTAGDRVLDYVGYGVG